jgi:hypothetical protein
MPYKNKRDKQIHNERYHAERLGISGTYVTLGNLKYPKYLDRVDPPYLSKTLKIGRKRVREFKTILPQEYSAVEGYEIELNRVEEKEIDVTIKKNGKPDTVIELTNYKKDSYISDKDAKRYLNEFNKHECKKILVVSYPQNLSGKWQSIFNQKGIEIRVMGYQA